MQIASPGKGSRTNRTAFSLTLFVVLLAALALLVNYFILSRRQRYCAACELDDAFARLPLQGFDAERLQQIFRQAALGKAQIDAPDRLAEQLTALFTSLHSQYQPNIVCLNDSSLPGPPRQRVFLAGNLHDSEGVLPHYVAQLTVLGALFPPGSLYVSLYESGSQDRTGKWLALLGKLLQQLGVPHTIVKGGTERRKGQDRIEFLAAMRNAAMQPLHDLVEEAGGENATFFAGSPTLARVRFDRVVFLNDVFFCAGDVLRLLHHQADLVCGMDFMADVLRTLPQDDVRPYGPYGPRLGVRPRKRDQVIFYDVWVARDANGLPFLNTRPFVSHQYSIVRMESGLPFPVTCCWNGLAVINALPFLEGYEFRAHMPGECDASECSLMCEDLLRLGYNRFVVDPSVRLAYKAKDLVGLYGDRVRGITVRRWATIAQDAVDFGYAPEKFYMTCCDKDPKTDVVHWEKCHPGDAYARDPTTRIVKDRF